MLARNEHSNPPPKKSLVSCTLYCTLRTRTISNKKKAIQHNICRNYVCSKITLNGIFSLIAINLIKIRSYCEQLGQQCEQMHSKEGCNLNGNFFYLFCPLLMLSGMLPSYIMMSSSIVIPNPHDAESL